VSKDTFKFNAAHFVALCRLSRTSPRSQLPRQCPPTGERQIGADGYVIDFGNVKAVCKDVCKKLNEHFICPIYWMF
jgi:6-pyruvoyl-tetrahydropterin synthase